jgi:ribosome-associated protein
VNKELIRSSLRRAAQISFSRSGGPGGQNVNKVNTKVTLRLDPRNLDGLSEAETARLCAVLAPKLSENGELVIAASEERSQKLNLERAYARAEALVASSARLPKKRRPTRPSKAEKERRLQSKRLHGEKKAERSLSVNPE